MWIRASYGVIGYNIFSHSMRIFMPLDNILLLLSHEQFFLFKGLWALFKTLTLFLNKKFISCCRWNWISTKNIFHTHVIEGNLLLSIAKLYLLTIIDLFIFIPFLFIDCLDLFFYKFGSKDFSLMYCRMKIKSLFKLCTRGMEYLGKLQKVKQVAIYSYYLKCNCITFFSFICQLNAFASCTMWSTIADFELFLAQLIEQEGFRYYWCQTKK